MDDFVQMTFSKIKPIIPGTLVSATIALAGVF